MHWYSFTDGNAWMTSNANQLCGTVTARINDHAAFIVKNGTNAPLFISEFGIDERGTNVKDNRFINCFLAFAAAGDFEWALWTLQGSYYFRNGRPDFEETYGIFNARWDGLRNPDFLTRLKSIQQPFQDPFSSQATPYQIIYHPASGNCLAAVAGDLKLESCDSSALFTFKTSEGALGLSDEASCITAQGDGQAAALSTQCTQPNSAWRTVSSSKLQIAVNSSTDLLCLDGSSSPQVLTKKCKDEDPEMQWFKVIQTNRKQSST